VTCLQIGTLFGRVGWGKVCNWDTLFSLQGTFSGWRNCIFWLQVLIEQLGKQKFLPVCSLLYSFLPILATLLYF